MKDISQYWINMGKVIGAHGIRGHLKVYSYTRPVTQILQYKSWRLSKQEVSWFVDTGFIDTDKANANKQQVSNINIADCLSLKVKKGSEKSNTTLMVKCQDIDDRNQAEALNHHFIYISGADLPTLDDDYYWFQLVGMSVVNKEGFSFGTVSDFFDNGANDVMVTQKRLEVLPEKISNESSDELVDEKHAGDKAKSTEKTTEYYLPYDKSFIDNIDTVNDIITIDWPSEL